MWQHGCSLGWPLRPDSRWSSRCGENPPFMHAPDPAGKLGAPCMVILPTKMRNRLNPALLVHRPENPQPSNGGIHAHRPTKHLTNSTLGPEPDRFGSDRRFPVPGLPPQPATERFSGDTGSHGLRGEFHYPGRVLPPSRGGRRLRNGGWIRLFPHWREWTEGGFTTGTHSEQTTRVGGPGLDLAGWLVRRGRIGHAHRDPEAR